MEPNEVSLINIVYQWGAGGQFLSYLIAQHTIPCLDSAKKRPAKQTNDNEYLYTSYHPFLNRTHPELIKDFRALRSNKIIVIDCDSNEALLCRDFGIYKKDKEHLDDNRFPDDFEKLKSHLDLFKRKLDSAYDRFIIISYTDLFLLQKEDAIKKIFDFCCMTDIDYKSIALQIKQYTETNLSNLKKHGINTSKYNIRSL